MPIFDDFERTYFSYKTRREPLFSFLNRSALAEFVEVRRRIESWYDEISTEDAGDLRSRLRSTNNADHNAAVFELLMHELLRQLGWTSKPHPVLKGTTHRPDFLATKAGGTIVMEATEVRPKSSMWSPDPLEDAILDAIDEMRSPDFSLDISTEGPLTEPLATSRVVGPLGEFMWAYDHGEVTDRLRSDGYGAVPRTRIECGPWAIEASLIPKGELRGKETRMIRSGPARSGFCDDVTPMRRALHNKAGKYGKTGMPFIIALNAPDVDSIDEEETLFGREQVSYTFAGGAVSSRATRAADGFWVGRGGKPRHTRLSAAWIFRGIAPWSIGAVPACLYVNPFAANPIPTDLLRLAHATVEDGALVRKTGVDLRDVSGLEPVHH